MCIPPRQKGNLHVTVGSKLNVKCYMVAKKKKKSAITDCAVSSSKGAVVKQILTLIGILFDYKFHKGRHSVGLAAHHIPIT